MPRDIMSYDRVCGLEKERVCVCVCVRQFGYRLSWLNQYKKDGISHFRSCWWDCVIKDGKYIDQCMFGGVYEKG